MSSLLQRYISGYRALGRLTCLRRDMRLASTFADSSTEVPPEPIDFNKKFKVPKYDGKLLLEIMNTHSLDSKITFDEVAHKYYYESEPMSKSVTEVVESYFEKFDPDLVVNKMITGGNWPRAGYLTKSGEPMTEEEVKRKWENQGEFARNKGTWMHFNIERYLNNLATSANLEEMQLFQSFDNNVLTAREIQPFRTEWRIAAPDIGLAGSVDFVGKLPDGTYAVIDWKRSKGLIDKMDNKYGKKAKRPLSHVPDCDGSKYKLQLNLYRYILQKYYKVKVSYMGLVSFYPNKMEDGSLDSYFLADVPTMDSEVEAVIADLQNPWGDLEGSTPSPATSAAAPAAPRAYVAKDRTASNSWSASPREPLKTKPAAVRPPTATSFDQIPF